MLLYLWLVCLLGVRKQALRIELAEDLRDASTRLSIAFKALNLRELRSGVIFKGWPIRFNVSASLLVVCILPLSFLRVKDRVDSKERARFLGCNGG